MPGSFDLSYSPTNAAVGKTKYSPDAIGAGLMGGGFDLGGILSALWQAKNQQKLKPITPNRQQMAPRPMGSTTDAVGETGRLAQIAQNRAQYGTQMSGGMPTRTMSGPGVIPGQTPDTNVMSGAQRAAFLPGNAMSASNAGLFAESSQPDYGFSLGTTDIHGPRVFAATSPAEEAEAQRLQAQRRALEAFFPRQAVGTRLGGRR